ncbi:hypothetical protein HGM15179_003861 [Zosterops borbonicus]|uniref:Uncharacterized protein n=1 Tax=Zosterops borbonicus TaxID=364589 RepID=A0A8K1GR91_9PASS|nr:hypothetical protein HGM15179_003861 [Zosterops borbonicus]
MVCSKIFGYIAPVVTLPCLEKRREEKRREEKRREEKRRGREEEEKRKRRGREEEEKARLWGDLVVAFHISPEERLQQLGLFSPGKKRLGENLINTYKYVKGRCQGDGAKLFSVLHSDGTRSNGHKLKHKTFHFIMRKNFIMVRVAEHWNRGHGVSLSGDLQNPSGGVPVSSAGGEHVLGMRVGLDDLQKLLPAPSIL